MSAIPILPGLAALADDYDGYVLDLWGVIHDGQRVFPHAVATLRELQRRGKRAVLLSNAPRREAVVGARNREIGLPDGLVEGLVTSGEEAWRHLAERPDDFYRGLGRHCLHLGGPRDVSMRDGLPYRFVAEVETADFILNTGSAEDDGAMAATPEILKRAAARDLPMVCANPDRVVIAGGRREPCAGAIAEAYEALGGRVRWHGKPYPEVYRRALELLAAEPARVLCVGDGMETDMAGAKAAGLASLFVLGGIHQDAVVRISSAGELKTEATGRPDSESLTLLALQYGVQPVAALERFLW